MKLYLDASSITEFLKCPEAFRRKYVANQISVYAAVPREFGIALHEGVDAYWKGEEFTAALSKASLRFLSIKGKVHANDKRKFSDALDYLPDVLAYYYDHIGESYSCRPELSESQFEVATPFGLADTVLVGRIDRYYPDGTLVDLKTASEIASDDMFGEAKGWKKSYRELMLRDFGLALYDWVLTQQGKQPKKIQLEVMVKPYCGKPCRLEILEMPELLAYRHRFAQQLEMVIRAIKAMAEQMGDREPWMMSTSACSGKYGPCDQLAYCLLGSTPRTERLYTIREEHLEGVESRLVL